MTASRSFQKLKATAFAPATVANVAVGFDILGFSFDLFGDFVTVEKIKEDAVKLKACTSPRKQNVEVLELPKHLPLDPAKNTATAGLLKMKQDLGLTFGFEVSIQKGIPLASGMGGSAASAVAAVVAANQLLSDPLTESQMLYYALMGEAQASGSYHADNIAACLKGGLTLARIRFPQVHVVDIPIPEKTYCVLVHPSISVQTSTARGLLKKEIELKTHVEQSAHLAGFVAGCFLKNNELIQESMKDVLIEPQRMHLIPGFLEVQKAALSSGTMNFSISGAGPSVFAWVKGQDTAIEVQRAMLLAFQKVGVKAQGWSLLLNQGGARIVI